MAIGWALLYKLAEMMGPGEYATPFRLMSAAGIEVNVVLMLLNLLPILPLDGGRIVAGLLPARASLAYARTEPLGFPILLVLMFSGLLGMILGPMVRTSFSVIGSVFRF
jgi:Zn-dependent protease